MEFYQFMLKRYQSSYQQAKCIMRFLLMVLPVMLFAVLIRHTSPVTFHWLLFATGWCTWTFVEYILHRFWMHVKGKNSTMSEIHTHHHKNPTEHVVTNFHRTAMIVVLAALTLVAMYLDNYFTLFVGFCVGFEMYLLIHRFIHLRIGQRIFKKLVRYHIYHHCKYTDTCFGVSVPWWDDLFKTIPAAPKITQRIVDFYFKDHQGHSEHSLVEYSSSINKSGCRTNSCNNVCNKCNVSLKGYVPAK